jgi:hypothetical protein
MDSGVLRDFVISITGGLILFLLVLVAIIGFLLYRQIKKMTGSVKDTIQTAKDMTSDIKEAIKSSKVLINMIKGEPPKEETPKNEPNPPPGPTP